MTAFQRKQLILASVVAALLLALLAPKPAYGRHKYYGPRETYYSYSESTYLSASFGSHGKHVEKYHSVNVQRTETRGSYSQAYTTDPTWARDYYAPRYCWIKPVLQRPCEPYDPKTDPNLTYTMMGSGSGPDRLVIFYDRSSGQPNGATKRYCEWVRM